MFYQPLERTIDLPIQILDDRGVHTKPRKKLLCCNVQKTILMVQRYCFGK